MKSRSSLREIFTRRCGASGEKRGTLGAMERAAQSRGITIPIVNYDEHQHAASENLRFAESVDGVETTAALLDMK
jgi:hypothetical protein